MSRLKLGVALATLILTYSCYANSGWSTRNVAASARSWSSDLIQAYLSGKMTDVTISRVRSGVDFIVPLRSASRFNLFVEYTCHFRSSDYFVSALFDNIIANKI